MASLRLYKTYSFRSKDPIIDELRTRIQDQKVAYSKISEKTGVSEGTLRNWFHGTTRRPQHPTVKAVIIGLGGKYEITWPKGKVK